MKIAQKYSHLNGEEYLLVHRKAEYKEIKDVVGRINANAHKTKISDEKGKKGKMIYSPASLNNEFKSLLTKRGWNERRRELLCIY